MVDSASQRDKAVASEASQSVPGEIAAVLLPGETIDEVFHMGDGLDVYTTDRRFFGWKQNRLAVIRYTEVMEAVRRTACWKTWHGAGRILIGFGFLGAGLVSGFADPLATATSVVLFLIGAGLVLLGILRRDDWLELKLQRDEPLPSFWYQVMFLPFWLMMKSRKRYRMPGDRNQVNAFCDYLTERLASKPPGRHLESNSV